MKIIIVGAGGVGGLLGGLLARSGNDVTLIARGSHGEAIRRDGLHVRSILGDLHINPVRVIEKITDTLDAELAIFCVKTWQLRVVAQDLVHALSSECLILPLENGVEAPEELEKHFAPKQVLKGCCHMITYIEKPGHIRHAAISPKVHFGSRSIAEERLVAIKACLDQAGVETSISDAIDVQIWEKFLYICSLAGVSALTRLPVGKIRGVPECRNLILAAMREIFDLARLKGIELNSNIFERMMAEIDSLPAEATTSLQRDLMTGKPSELNALCGAVVRLAQPLSMVTPIHSVIYGALLPTEYQSRKALV